MKKRRTSIRFRLTGWFALSLLLLLAITFAIIMYAGRNVLDRTIRGYLMSTVEANVDQILYQTEEAGEKAGVMKIDFSGGAVLVDEDFMDVVNDVRTALYDGEGRLLYGENPLPHVAEEIPFTDSRLWEIRRDGVSFDLYDRKLTLDLPEGQSLWIRGVVSETESDRQMKDIGRVAALLMLPLAVLAILLSWLLAGRVLSPIRRMQQTAESISTGDDLSRRIETAGRGDELDRLGEVFNHMLDRLEEAFRKEQQFTSDVSHELRTPMTVIMAQCETALESIRTPEEYDEALRVIHRQGGRMSRLIEDMLMYTRMERSGDAHYPMARVDLSALTADMADSLSLLREKNITLTAEVEPDIFIQGNQELLERMLENLVANAYRYGRQDGWIRVELSHREGRPVLCVADNGIGISAEDQKHIFDRFYRADTSRSTPGAGLGLSMVQKIAQIHGAKVQVESILGEGSRFLIFF